MSSSRRDPKILDQVENDKYKCHPRAGEDPDSRLPLQGKRGNDYLIIILCLLFDKHSYLCQDGRRMQVVNNVYAVEINPTTWPLAGPTEFQSLGGMVSYLLPKALIAGGVIFFILIVIAGVGMIAGAGSEDAQAKEKAKNFLTYAVLGLIIMFAAYWILQIINYLTQNALGDVFKYK